MSNGSDELTALGLADLSTADRAGQFSTAMEYSADGTPDEYGPLHRITLAEKLTGTTTESTLAAGTVIPARAHTSYAYDENKASAATVSDLVTSSPTGATIAGYATDAETKTTTTTYDWSTGAEPAVRTATRPARPVRPGASPWTAPPRSSPAPTTRPARTRSPSPTSSRPPCGPDSTSSTIRR
ncbi:hypothetical protein ACIBBD_28025 [Streptomyces sp. NPDC051315]|uniref:hypothetical protein n=1 Tax=Streptomyces sp. NPDC051315 TaxID=3365650 RepID=UPI00379619DB